MQFKKKTVLLKGGFVSMKKNSFGIVDKEPIVQQSNMIVGKLMKSISQSANADQSVKIIGGDIMDFNKGVKTNVKRLHKRKEDENIKFIY